MKRLFLLAASAAVLSACGQPQTQGAAAPSAAPAQPAAAQPAQSPAFDPQQVNQAAFTAPPTEGGDRSPTIVRAQVLLDRARFSPGVIDGTMGENVRQAIAAYEEANGLPVDGQIDEAVFQRLTQADGAPALTQYTISPQDVAGPYFQIPEDDLTALSKLPKPGYANILEALAERFHMTEELIQALNPGVDFNKAGQVITVAAVSPTKLPTAVASIEVDKQEKAVRALDAEGNLVAFYPATIGSTDMPAPAGSWKVKGVAPAPTYTFDPARVTYKQKGVTGKVTVKAGPNNPVGAVWIDLTKDTYGIHGTPDPRHIGKTNSHGCVRLTNWDAQQLATGVKPGVKVVFLESSSDSAMRKGAAGSDAAAT